MDSEQVKEAVEFILDLELDRIISEDESDRRLEMIMEDADNEDLFLMW